MRLECSNTIEASVYRKLTGLTKVVKASILINAEDADRSGSRIKRVKKLAISANGDVEVCTAAH